jgi:hypothetical protein
MKTTIITASLLTLAASAMAGQYPDHTPMPNQSHSQAQALKYPSYHSSPSLSRDQAQVLKYAGAPFAQNPRSLEQAARIDSPTPCSMTRDYLSDPNGQQLLFSAMAENQLSPKQGQELMMDYQRAMCGGGQF